MEYQKIINLFGNKPNQPTKFRTKNWIEINDESRGMFNTNSQIKFKTSMLRSSLCNYSDAYILVSGTITVPNTGIAANSNIRKIIAIKNYTPFTDYISEINNTQIDNAIYIDIIMSVYDLIEYSDKYSKTSGILWQYYRDDLFLNKNGDIADFPADNNNSAFLKLKQK